MNPRTPLSREHVEQFNRDGFVVVKGLLSSPEYEVLQSFCTSGSDLGKLQTKVRDTGTRTYKVAIWTTLDGSLFGKLPRLPRVVFGIQQLLGEPVYHWHSKVLRKQPGDGSVGIHQDYATWYEDGCLAPKMLTCTLALERNDRGNGSVYFVPGSHKMARLHRVRLGKTSDTHGPDPARVDEIVRRNGIVYSELEPGDGLFFHCMTLHGSEANLSDRTRTVIHCSYNAVANQPIPQPGQAHHRYQPLEVVEDDFLATRNYTELYRPRTFHSPESENDPGAGIFYRQSDQDVM